MKVILQETIDSLGIIGSEVTVADGYARNFLLPQKKAVLATPQNRKILEQDKGKFEIQIAKEKGLAEEMAKKLGLVSMAGVPLQVQNEKVIGVLNCFTSRPHDFSEPEVNLITTVANQAAAAIINTELVVKTKVIQEELETRKLVERAKEVLMRRRKMDGNEAFRWIQKRSMNSRKSIRQLAEAILLSEELD